MSDKVRAKKLAAAKKKLKEYQTKEKHVAGDVDSSDTSECGKQDKQNFASYQQEKMFFSYENDLSKDSNCLEEVKTNDNNNEYNVTTQQTNIIVTPNSINDYFKTSNVEIEDFLMVSMPVASTTNSISVTAPTTTLPAVSVFQDDENAVLMPPSSTIYEHEKLSHVNAMEILIAEKANLTSELTKQQTLCKEKTFEVEELMVQLQIASDRNKSLEEEVRELHLQNVSLKNSIDQSNVRYQEQHDEFERQKLKNIEITEHLEELKRELNEEHSKNVKLEQELKEKICDLELSHIRINQISDEANLATDNRVETLTQTKFMYEQQIRDLQAMVQQLTTERDQANQQYQNYVQHLNKEMTNINEKNAELIAENEQLANRERTLIAHIGNLEKQIQDNITKQENLKTKNDQLNTATENLPSSDIEKLLLLENEIETFKTEKMKLENENEMKDVKLKEITMVLNEKTKLILELEEKIDNILSERPNDKKILETMESNKIAASKAVLQNTELKKQLDEVQQKLIQVTNDKVELMNELDSEQYKNRKIHENYEKMENDLKETKEKLHFKDEEMIRLTHEQSTLNKTILELNQQIERLVHFEIKERKQKEVAENLMEGINTKENIGELISNYTNMNRTANNDEHYVVHNNDHTSHNHSHGDHDHCDDNNFDYDHSHEDFHNEKKKCEEFSSEKFSCKYDDHLIANGIPTDEAMGKLQERFMKLMSEVADLTDEKQRLEHLVCQLQGETETIGEYITLYQTQRRVLKQREIEKTTQLRMLLTEREEMKEKIADLKRLVELLIQNNNSQVITTSSPIAINDNFNNSNTNNSSFDTIKILNKEQQNSTEKIENDIDKKNNITISRTDDSLETSLQLQNNPILAKIQNLIVEIKQKEDSLETNLKLVPSVDHCACCLGKFETI